MSKEAKRTGVASYDPRWVDVWVRAALDPVKLPFPDKKSAIAQRHSLYRLRDAMRLERHPMSGEADKCKVSGPHYDDPAADKEGPCYMVVRSKETAEGQAALEAAGFTTRPLPDLRD